MSSKSTMTSTAVVAAVIVAFLSTFSNVNVNGDTDTDTDTELTTTPKTTIVEIRSLEDHCEKNICRGFHFDDVTQVAFFDLKAEVHITEESTYDLNSALEYESLVFKNSTFAHFPLHFFYSLWVKELDMRNCSVERLTWENFLMAGDLKILLLSNNRIQHIDEMTFNYASELQYLFLDSNHIDSLVSESFKGLINLKLLDLHDNRLRELPEGVFDYFDKLQELNLAHNRLRVLTDDIFTKIPNLLTLLLQQNRLRDIGEYAFQHQNRLMLLDISKNIRLESLVNNLSVQYLVASNCSLYRINLYGNISKVDLQHNRIVELYFSQPEMLDSLNLRNNALQQIASLSRARNLRTLQLANNPELGSLPDPWTVLSLQHLDLSNTSMSDLPITSLGDKNELRSLNISNNRMREINPRNFQYLEGLKHFYIHANDWNCFNLKMIMDLLIRPYKMYFTRDPFDSEFPGEYINGIACMYRIPDVDDPLEMMSQNYIVLSKAANSDPALETKNLRKELKAIVQFYEEKFSKAFDMINELKRRLEAFEKINNTVWQHVTITT